MEGLFSHPNPEGKPVDDKTLFSEKGTVLLGEKTFDCRRSLFVRSEQSIPPIASYIYEIINPATGETIAQLDLFLSSFPQSTGEVRDLAKQGEFDYVVSGYIVENFKLREYLWLPNILFQKRLELVAELVSFLKKKDLISLGKRVISCIKTTNNRQKDEVTDEITEKGKWTGIMMERYNRSHKDTQYKKVDGTQYYIQYFTV